MEEHIPVPDIAFSQGCDHHMPDSLAEKGDTHTPTGTAGTGTPKGEAPHSSDSNQQDSESFPKSPH